MTKTVGRRTRRPETIRALIAAHTVVDEAGCWIWQGTVSNVGYGRLRWQPNGVKVGGAHRVSYWAHIGPVADGLHLDHLCRNRACCNPAHLEPVTPRENGMRSPIAVAARNAAKTHCPQGHAYDQANTRWSAAAGRQCRACQNTASARYKATRKAVAA